MSDQPERRVFRVGELNRRARQLLEDRFGQVWVEGELSDVKVHASGHVYFTLNDPREVAQLRGVMFRGDARRSKARLARGVAVRFRGQLSIYPERGSYQLVARFALPAGAGDLHAQFERIRQRLAKEGLLAPERRRPLPAFPRVVGVVTSAHGAAMHDIVRVAKGRFPVRLVVADCRVQGEAAPESIVEALLAIQRLPGVEVIVLARGGGSGEDLWAFNHEGVARTVAESKVPIVSGVGHETDLTIVDLVADSRASTPSNAAEQVLPERGSLEAQLDALRHRLERAAASHLDRNRLRLAERERQLPDPRGRVRRLQGQVSALSGQLTHLGQRTLAERTRTLRAFEGRLLRLDPSKRLADRRRELTRTHERLRGLLRPRLQELRHRLNALAQRVEPAGQRLLVERRRRFERLEEALAALDPTRVLSRGYAIALAGGQAVLDADQVRPGEELELRLHRGRLHVRVERAETDRPEEDLG